jgi:hypothetical protein
MRAFTGAQQKIDRRRARAIVRTAHVAKYLAIVATFRMQAQFELRDEFVSLVVRLGACHDVPARNVDHGFLTMYGDARQTILAGPVGGTERYKRSTKIVWIYGLFPH